MRGHYEGKQSPCPIRCEIYMFRFRSDGGGSAVRCLFCALCCSQRRKERKQQRRLQRLNHQREEEGEAQNARKRIRRELMPSAVRLVLDCSFDNLMPIKVNSWGINAEGMPYIYKLRSALCLSWPQQSSCVFRMYESFTNRSNAAMLWTDEPYIQCRLVTAVAQNSWVCSVWCLASSLFSFQFYVTSLGGQLKQSMDEKDKGWVNWKVNKATC